MTRNLAVHSSTNLEIWVKTPEAPRFGRGPQSCSSPLDGELFQASVSPPSSPLMSCPCPRLGLSQGTVVLRREAGKWDAPSLPAPICLLPASPSPFPEKEGRWQELAAHPG